MMHRIARALLCLAVGGGMMLRAQAPVGSISGIVHDQSGAVIAGAAIDVKNKDTGVERHTVTGADGAYGIAALPAGAYTLRAEAAGFRTLIENATVQVGQATIADMVMQLGATKEVINVEAEAAQIEYDSHTLSGVITRERIESLPLNGRDFLQLAMLAPGVTVSANSLGQYNRNFDVTILGADSANGSVRITVDGATIADSVTGGTQQNFSQEVVQEFQLSSTNMDLSTSVGAGGAINVVTRSGGNDFHGSGFFFFRDHNLSAYPYLQRDPHEPASPFFARRQTGYQFGGPIKKDRLFFFSNLEYTNQTGVYSEYPGSVDGHYFDRFASFAASPFHETEIQERLDWHVNAKHNAFVRYSHDGNKGYGPSEPGIDLPSDWDVNTNWADSGVFSLISVIGPSMANEFRYSMTYWTNTNNPPTAAQCPAPCLGLGLPNISILDVSNFTIGNATNAPQTRVLRRHIFADNVSKQVGAHAMKFGAYWEYQQGAGTYAYYAPAAAVLFGPSRVQAFNAQVPAPYQISLPASFNSLNDILQLPVSNFAMGVGDVNQPPLWNRGNADHGSGVHFFWQDTWRVRPRFSLNYGLAWTYETNTLNYDLTKPQYLAPIFGAGNLGHELHSPHNFSPMLGFAWTATRDNKTVVRGGAGIYYDTMNIEIRLIERAMLGPAGTGRVRLPDSLFFPIISALNGFYALPAPWQPTALASEPTTFSANELMRLLPVFYAGAQQELGSPNNTSLAIRNIDNFKTGTELLARNFREPYAEHASIGVEREVRPDLVVSADFVFRQYMHTMIRDTDLNHFYSVAGPVIPACPGLPPYDPKAECSSGYIQGIISGARGHYKGLLVKLDKRFAHRTTGTLSYAYASQVGYNGLVDDSNWFASWGPQSGHQILSGSLVVDLPHGFQVSGITSFTSAGPIEPFIPGVDLNGNGAFEAGEVSGSPLPGAGFNQFGVNYSKSDLIRFVNQFDQKYPALATVGQPNFSFPRSFNSQDLRVTKTFHLGTERLKLALLGECFNVFNIANLGGYSFNLGNWADFSQPTTRAGNIFGSGGPRAFQLGTRLTF